MGKEVMVCGVDCHPGDENCNNYCNHDKTKPGTEQERRMHARREIGKWLNEQPNREIDRQALALLCAEYDLMRQGDTCARMCEATAYRTELRRLQRLIVAYVNASNNDDSAGDAFGALVEAAASVPN